MDEGGDIRHFFLFYGDVVDAWFDLIGIFGLDVSGLGWILPTVAFPHDFDGAVEGDLTDEF